MSTLTASTCAWQCCAVRSRLCRLIDVTLRILVKLPLAAGRAEILHLSVILARTSRPHRVYLHPADGINRWLGLSLVLSHGRVHRLSSR